MRSTSDDRQQQRIERFTQVFSRVNSVLTLRPLKVATTFSLREAPAWSTAEEITFNARLLGNLDTPREIASIKGLDLHEVAHVLYTPRNGSDIFEWVQDNNLFFAYNALEDQRIETLLVGRYPSIKDWLTATMLMHLVETNHFDNAYPLLRGRRYLPVEVRQAALKAYKHPDKAQQVRDIVDEYRMLLFPQDTERAKGLIKAFADLLSSQPPEGGGGEGGGGEGGVPTDIPNPHGHGDRPHEGTPSTDSRPASKREQERDRDSAKRQDEADETDLDDDTDGSGDGSSEADDDGGDNGGGEPAGDENPDIDAIKDAFNDIVDSILSENEREIEDISRQIKGLPSLSAGNAKEPEKREIKQRLPDADTVSAARSFGRELERIRTACDPAWDRQQSAGRLNALRAGRGDDITTVYDSWNMGRQDATDIECVILLDISGSMGGNKADSAYRAMYAIKRALDRIDAKTTVLTFSDHAYTLYSRDEKADLYIRDSGAFGGTSADGAVAYATKLLAETDKPVRLFIAITDGEWWQPEKADEQIARMRRAGVLTALGYIHENRFGTLKQVPNTHNCETAVVINNIPDIIGIARGVVRSGISRRLLNA